MFEKMKSKHNGLWWTENASVISLEYSNRQYKYYLHELVYIFNKPCLKWIGNNLLKYATLNFSKCRMLLRPHTVVKIVKEVWMGTTCWVLLPLCNVGHLWCPRNMQCQKFLTWQTLNWLASLPNIYYYKSDSLFFGCETTITIGNTNRVHIHNIIHMSK